MPSLYTPRQPDHRCQDWFRQGVGQRLITEVQAQALPELGRAFGHTGLYLRPAQELPATLSGHKLARIISLYRTPVGFDGPLRCLDGQLPFTNSSLSLVYALFALETSADPESLLQEISRTLKPEGIALIISLNPASPSRLRWAQQRMPSFTTFKIERGLRDAGMEVVRRHYLGPVWLKSKTLPDDAPGRWLPALRAASLVVARRRETALTPLRETRLALNLRQGLTHG